MRGASVPTITELRECYPGIPGRAVVAVEVTSGLLASRSVRELIVRPVNEYSAAFSAPGYRLAEMTPQFINWLMWRRLGVDQCPHLFQPLNTRVAAEAQGSPHTISSQV